MYQAAQLVGSNPFKALDHSFKNIDTFLDRGNFRPIGRAIENLERALVFDFGEATGLPPHAVNGAFRIILIALLAIVSCNVVSALLRSAGAVSAKHLPTVVLYPMVLAGVLVAGDHYSPMTSYMFVLTGSVIVILATGLCVARDRDMSARRLAWHEVVVMIGLGAVLATTYDLLYLAPPFSGAYVAARAAASGSTSKLLRLASLRRWLLLSVGFLTAFVPVRIEIFRRCRLSTCYSATDPDLTVDALGRTADRLVTGLPPAGWRYSADLLDRAGARTGHVALARNALLAILLVAVVFIAFTTARHLIRRASAREMAEVDWKRSAAALGALGVVTALMPSLLAGLSKRTQSVRPAIGEAWRETLLVQVGWSLVAAALLTVTFGLVGRSQFARVVVILAAGLLCGSMALTLLANARVTRADRITPLHAITSEMATAAIHFDPTPAGNVRRCGLVDSFTAIRPGTKNWVSGPNVGAELDGLMLDIHNARFCEPTNLRGGAVSPPEDAP
ncbi:hypothetical protein [Candidatus Poriferisodalis sp.]|uniref:hypothetical protein n=1 Tax=Candidatus Poriferisodalis sp. TaxID=3101277 RepID=UPI003D14BC3F